MESPCIHCPWRVSNQGKRHPDGWYTKANLRRLWARLRTGDGMSCHPTDPGNPVSDAAAAAGYRAASVDARPRECRGAAILVQREFEYLQADCGVNIRRYQREHPRGLTRDGIAMVVNRAMFGGVADMLATASDDSTHHVSQQLPVVDLNCADVQHEPLGTWEPRTSKLED
jgi:hypothetical protein